MEVLENTEKILVIGDFISSGFMGGSLCRDILNFYSYDVDFLPSALISNKFSQRPIEIFDSSLYLKNTLDVYSKQKRQYKAILVGFVLNINQAKIICNYVKENNLFMILDPIMGDGGKIYNGLNQDIVEIYKYMANFANIIIPNLTEANLLTDYKLKTPYEIVDFFENNEKKLIITSVKDKNKHFILSKDKDYIEEEYIYLNKSFGGSGDLFDSIFLAHFLKNEDYRVSIKKTKEIIAKILNLQINLDDKTEDIYVNKILKKL